MNKYLPLICRSPLFSGMQQTDVSSMLTCLQAYHRTFSKQDIVFRVGQRARVMGIVLSGSVRIERQDYWGNRSIIASFEPGQSFGEAYACSPHLLFDVNVVAAQDSVLLFLDAGRIATMCPSTCTFHARLVRNLLEILALRAHALTRKIEHVSKRSTRAKLLSYFSDQAHEAGSSSFVIPFNRQELADYLSVDRSAMCSELSRMHKDGIIEYKRNLFELKQRSQL